jgi:hypothetical protein
MIFTKLFQRRVPALRDAALLPDPFCAQPCEAHGMALAPCAINVSGVKS